MRALKRAEGPGWFGLETPRKQRVGSILGALASLAVAVHGLSSRRLGPNHQSFRCLSYFWQPQDRSTRTLGPEKLYPMCPPSRGSAGGGTEEGTTPMILG